MRPASERFKAMMTTRAVSCEFVARLVPEWSTQYVAMLRNGRATEAHVERLRAALGFGQAYRTVDVLHKPRDDGSAARLAVIRAAALG